MNAMTRRRARFARALDATGLSDLAIANRLRIASSTFTRLRYYDMQPSLYTSCLLLAAFGDQFELEDFLTPQQARAIESVRGVYAKPI